MTVRISRAALDAIFVQMHGSGQAECCGLLLSRRHELADSIDAILTSANVAADPVTRFEIDPATLLRAHRAEREGRHRILGCYHSHPGGDPAPSAADAAHAVPNDWLWLICTPASPPLAGLWRACARGVLHNRFDAVEMIVDAGP